MSIFIKDHTFKLDFWIKSLGDFNYKFVNEKQWRKMTDDQRVDFDHCWVLFRPLTWRLHNELREKAIYDNPQTGMKDWSQPTFAQEKMKAVVADWSFTEEDEDGNMIKVKVCDQALEAMHPGIAEVIMDTYEDKTEITDDKKKV